MTRFTIIYFFPRLGQKLRHFVLRALSFSTMVDVRCWKRLPQFELIADWGSIVVFGIVFKQRSSWADSPEYRSRAAADQCLPRTHKVGVFHKRSIHQKVIRYFWPTRQSGECSFCDGNLDLRRYQQFCRQEVRFRNRSNRFFEKNDHWTFPWTHNYEHFHFDCM